MAKKPLWKEAQELREEYKKRGINYCYNERNRNVYLKVLNAPEVVEGVEGCQLTGYLILYGGVRESRDINYWINQVKSNYISHYKSNPLMIKYADTILI